MLRWPRLNRLSLLRWRPHDEIQPCSAFVVCQPELADVLLAVTAADQCSQIDRWQVPAASRAPGLDLMP